MPQEQWILNNAQFYTMIIGDFLGMIFGFYIIIYVVDNIRSCRKTVEEVDNFVRTKSKKLKRSASVSTKKLSSLKKQSNNNNNNEYKERMTESGEQEEEEEEVKDVEGNSSKKVSFKGKSPTLTTAAVGVYSDLESGKLPAGDAASSAMQSQLQSGSTTPVPRPQRTIQERRTSLNPTELFAKLDVLSIISEDSNCSGPSRSRSQSYVAAMDEMEV